MLPEKTAPAPRPRLSIGADCFLENVAPEVIRQLKEQLTIANPKYQDARKYGRWIGKKLKPFLYFYEEEAEGLRFPRGLTGKARELCRQYMDGITPELIDTRHELPPVSMQFRGELRPYQHEATTAICRYDFGVLEAGTGSGKTVIALAIMARRQQPALVLVHTKELLYQWAEKVRTFLDMEAGLIGDGQFAVRPLTIAIVNTARNHLDTLPEQFGHICVDECHRVPATLFTEVVKAFNCRYSLGLSATAFRRDGLTGLIHFYLGSRSHQVNAEKIHDAGAVLKAVYLQKETGFRYFYKGNYQDLLKALTNNEERNQLIVADIIREAKNAAGTVLVVSDRVAHCQTLAAMLASCGVKAEVLTGQLARDTRTDLVAALHTGAVKVLISTLQLIGEGFDCHDLHTLFLTTPIKFTGRLFQVVGRILRPAEGKKPKVYDYVDPVKVLQKSAKIRREALAGE